MLKYEKRWVNANGRLKLLGQSKDAQGMMWFTWTKEGDKYLMVKSVP